MEGGAIVLSHYSILSIHVTTFTDEVFVPSRISLYTEEDAHQGSKRLYI